MPASLWPDAPRRLFGTHPSPTPQQLEEWEGQLARPAWRHIGRNAGLQLIAEVRRLRDEIQRRDDEVS